MSRIGINGFGRVGRSVLRLAVEDSAYVVAINDPKLTVQYMVYLFKYDSTHGRFKGKVYADPEGYLVVNAQRINVYNEENPEDIDWISAGAQYIVECSGVFTKAKHAARHLQAGAKRVFICGTCSGAPILVCGVNWDTFVPDMTVISMACSTTNCLAPLASIVHTNFEIIEGFVTAVHSVTAAHKTIDNGMGLSWRDCRGSLQNIIPGKGGAASAMGKIIPELDGKLSDSAFRVPTANVSVLDFTVRLGREATLDEIKAKVQEAAEGPMKGIIGYTDDEVVSADFKSDIRSCIFDARASIALNSQFVKLVAWFDNEYAYAKRLIDLIRHVQLTDFPQGFETTVESAVEVVKVESKTGKKGRVRAKVMHIDEEVSVIDTKAVEEKKPEEGKPAEAPEEVKTQKLDDKSEAKLEVKISEIQKEKVEGKVEEPKVEKQEELAEKKSEVKLEENKEVKAEPSPAEAAAEAPAEAATSAE